MSPLPARSVTALLLALALLLTGCSRQPAPIKRTGHSTPISLARFPQSTILIEGPPEDQTAINSFVYATKASIDKQPPAPFVTLSNQPNEYPRAERGTLYNGHVFWDADLWVFPALALLDPERAKAIPDFRLHTMTPEAWKTGAWEVDLQGNNATPPSSRLHASGPGAYAFGLAWAADLGLADPGEVRKAIEQARLFYRRKALGREILTVRSINEYAEKVDNELYTNLLAGWCENRGKWAEPMRYLLPLDGHSFLTWAADRVTAYQQAAAVLAIWPLQYPAAEDQAKNMLERFEPKVSPNGPAMSDSVHALIWARLGETERAYATWQKSWKDFTDRELNFRENRKRPDRTYFVTGAAGCLNTVLYGFLGFRIDSKKPSSAAWHMSLGRGVSEEKWLSVQPNLPAAWKSVTLKNFVVRGKRLTLIATHSGVRVTQGDP